MNAAFFGLAGLAALNPKLLILDLILATNRRPRQMFVCFLLGAIGLNLTIGLLDVFVLHLDAIKTQNHNSGALDLALGIPLLAIGALLQPTTCIFAGAAVPRRLRSRRRSCNAGWN